MVIKRLTTKKEREKLKNEKKINAKIRELAIEKLKLEGELPKDYK